MHPRLPLLLVPILAIALPLVALGAIGYLWLTLDRDAAARRSKDAAALEAERLRTVLLERMAGAAADVDRTWQAADQARPFALRKRPHLLVAEAYRFTPDGRPDDPDYDAAFQQAVRAGLRTAEGMPASDAGIAGDTLRRTRQAFAFLDTGRQALAGRRPSAAIEAAERLLECCAAARDEFGVSLAVLAARTTEVGVLNMEDGSREVLIPAQKDTAVPAAWSPDGRFLVYLHASTGLRVMDVRSRESWPLCSDPGDAEFCKRLDARASWAQSGAFIVVGHREPARVERVAWEGVTAEAVAKLMRSK